MLSPRQIINIQPAPPPSAVFLEKSLDTIYVDDTRSYCSHKYIPDTVTVELCKEHTVSLLTFTLREEGGDVATEMGIDNNIIQSLL